MRSVRLFVPAAAALGLVGAWVLGQVPPPGAVPPPPSATPPAPAPVPPPPATTPPAPTPPPSRPSALTAPPTAVPNPPAATVHGQHTMEIAVQRALKNFKPEQREQVRPDIINFLVDKALIDQHVAQFRVTIDAKDVEAKIKQVRDEIEKRGSTFEKVMHETMLTEAELKTEIEGQLRWETFVQSQATDKVLRELFDSNREVFDGTTVRARHILLTVDDPKAVDKAKAKALELRKQIEDIVAQGMAKLPATADALARERERVKLMENAFADVAGKASACPSRTEGGELGYFPRTGRMVEPFSFAAFHLKPGQMSDAVVTEFGVHLILVTDRKQGKQLKYEEVQEEVKMVFGDRLRETLLPQLRQKAKIEILTPKP